MRLSPIRAFLRLRKLRLGRRTPPRGGVGGEKEGVQAVTNPPRDVSGPAKIQWPQVDQPISTCAADLLDRGPFVQRVVQVLDELQALEDSSVLALVGPWGSGKSSLINLVSEHVGAPWQVRRASTWAPPDISALLADLFATIRSALPEGERTRRLKDLLTEYAQFTVPALGAIPVVGSAAQEVAANLVKLRAERPMQSMFDELTAKLSGLDLRVLVVLDDVDRLQPDELLALLKAIRLLARFPGVYYLLAYDEQTVIDVLTATAVAQNSSDRALAYLEKIVQVRLDMPPAQRFYTEQMLSSGITALLDRLGISLSGEQTVRFRVLYDTLLQFTLSQPRAVGRFLRQANAYLPMPEPDEIDVVDFLALTHLRSLVPATYRLLARSRSSLAVPPSGPVGQPPDAVHADVERSLDEECADYSDQVLAVITELFPVFATDYLEQLQPADWQLRAATRRVAIEEYFDRYFFFGVPADDIADATVCEALAAIGRDEPSVARAKVEAQLAGADPGRADRTVRKLIRFSRSPGHLDARDLVAVLEYALALPSQVRLSDRLLGSPEHQGVTWATALLGRLNDAGQCLDSGFAAGLGDAEFSVLCQALRNALLIPREGNAGLLTAYELAAQNACDRIRAHLRDRDEADSSFPVLLLVQFVNRTASRAVLAETISQDLGKGRFDLAGLAARFVTVGRFQGEQEELIGFDDETLIALMGLPRLWSLSETGQSQDADTGGSVDERDISWPSRRRAGLTQLRKALVEQRSVPPRPPSGVHTGAQMSAAQQTSPTHWGSQISHGPATPDTPGNPLCIRAAVLLPGAASGLPASMGSVPVSEEARAQVLARILGEVPFTAWCRDRARVNGIVLGPAWSESGNENRIFAELVLKGSGSDGQSPWRAHCMISTGPSSPAPDALAIGLDLILSLPLRPETGQQDEASIPGVDKFTVQELVEMSETVMESAILAARRAARELLRLDTDDGHLAVWLATRQSLDQVIDLTEFPIVGNQAAPSEAAVFATLPLEPGQADGSAEFSRSVRGVAVELAHELLRTAHCRDYTDFLHKLRD